ncbi:hypothetical protein BGX26_001237, partial [Mortierella sp. AD094]
SISLCIALQFPKLTTLTKNRFLANLSKKHFGRTDSTKRAPSLKMGSFFIRAAMLCIGALTFAAMVESAEAPGCRCKNGSKLANGGSASNKCCLQVMKKNSVFSSVRGDHCDISTASAKDKFLDCCKDNNDSPGACWSP